MTYLAADDRYDERQPYNRVGRSGLKLPAVSLGLWHNFGDDKPFEIQRAILRRAFDLGVTHFDLANNYGPPPGSAETNFGRHFREDFAPYRDELVISTKAGYDMWPGPYGEWGSRKYLLSSLDQSLERMGLDYVDIFYSHRYDPETPLEETMGALDHAVRSGKALYAGISSYSPEHTVEAARILRGDGHAAADPPALLLDAQPVDRGRAARRPGGGGRGLHRVLAAGAGNADRPLPRRHPRGLAGRPGRFLTPEMLTDETMRHIRALNEIAQRAGPVAGADGAGLGAARHAGHLGADRREQRRAAGEQPRGGGEPVVRRRRAGGDRPGRGRGGRQHLGRVQPGLTHHPHASRKPPPGPVGSRQRASCRCR